MTRAVLINLDRDADRLTWMRDQLDRLGVAFERLPALLGSALPEPYRAYFDLDDTGAHSRLSRGEVGCYASHLAAMEAVVRDGSPYALIMEDDLGLGEKLPTTLAAVDRFPKDWDIVRLSGLVKSAVVPVLPIEPGLDLVKYSRVPLGAGAYLISLQGARKYLAWAKTRPLALALDQDLRRVWDCQLNTYGVYPPPVEQDVLQRSSIDTFGPRATVRTRSLRNKLALHGWRYFLEPVDRAAYNLARLGPAAWAKASLANATARVGKRFRRKVRAAA